MTHATAETRTRRTEPVPGRLAVLTGASLLVGFVPLPFVPGKLLEKLRGAIAYDATSRHGISLSSDARAVLADPSSGDRMRAVLRRTIELIARRLLRRVGPLAPLSVAASAFEVFALGHLLERYLKQVRPAGAVRIHEPEALTIRRLVDDAVVRAFHPSTSPEQLLLTEGAEDLRDEFTRWIDTVLLTGATLPSYLERRLERAFDEIVESRRSELTDHGRA